MAGREVKVKVKVRDEALQLRISEWASNLIYVYQHIPQFKICAPYEGYNRNTLSQKIIPLIMTILSMTKRKLIPYAIPNQW